MSKEGFEAEKLIKETRPGEATERGVKGPGKKEVLQRHWEREIAADKATKEAEKEKRREWYRQPIGQEETESSISENPETEENEKGEAETEIDVKKLVDDIIKSGQLNWKDREKIERLVPVKGNEAQGTLRLLKDEEGFLNEKINETLGKKFFIRIFNRLFRKREAVKYLERRLAKISQILLETRLQLPGFHEKEDWEHEMVQVMDYLESEIVLLSYKKVKSEDIAEIAEAENEIDKLRSLLGKLYANWKERLFKKNK